MAREDILTGTLVQLADTLVDDFDIVDILGLLIDRCAEILDVSAAGLMLVSPEGVLRLAASSSEAMRIVELFEIQSQEGPCLDCFHSGEPVINVDPATAMSRWPRFTPVAIEAGFRSLHALPMRLRSTIIGAINLFNVQPRELGQADVLAGRALADMATIAIFQNRVAVESLLVSENLNHALTSRLLIEQAKGILAESRGIEVEEAFSVLREQARDHKRGLIEVAQDVVDSTRRQDKSTPDRS